MSTTIQLGLQPDGTALVVMVVENPDVAAPLLAKLGPLPETARALIFRGNRQYDGSTYRVLPGVLWRSAARIRRDGLYATHRGEAEIDTATTVAELSAAWLSWLITSGAHLDTPGNLKAWHLERKLAALVSDIKSERRVS